MKRAFTDVEICERHNNETAHAEHVVALALRLYDRTAKTLTLPSSYRRLLESAARLHDIGFRYDPLRHHARGAQIVLQEGLAGCTPSQVRVVAGAVMLHRGRPAELLKDSLFRDVRNLKPVLAVAAFLRVADGLDHGHLQDVRILSVCRRGPSFRVRVATNGHQDNLARAGAKADLWHDVFDMELNFVEEPAPRKIPFGDVVRKGDRVIETVRRILCLQYRLMDEGCERLVHGTDEEALHDMRVAINRFRQALRLFRPFLAGTSAGALRKRLGRFRSQLGRPRDIEVWMAFLDRRALKRKLAPSDAWQAYRDLQAARHRYEQEQVVKLLQSQAYTEVKVAAALFVRDELSRLAKAAPGVPFKPYVAGKLRRGYRKVMREKIAGRRLSAKKLHQLRIRYKRLRYWAEFGAPVLGPTVACFAGQLKAVTSALGDVHDLDVFLTGPLGDDCPHRDLVEASILRKRSSAYKAFLTAWESLSDVNTRKRVTRVLLRAEGTQS